ncbi:MAG: prepilin-type N-terminal cleavage/methylation domain-containing protein [Candidatus Omnitrophota bacterium]|jgi:prepilin-type N-terminal cleavage/methylation domain-containing protein
MRNNRAYTIMEMIIVVVIIGLLAGLSVPNYKKTKEKNIEKHAFRGLLTIGQSILPYLVQNEITTIPDLATIDAINTEFQLSISEPADVVLRCWGVHGGEANKCRATLFDATPEEVWAIEFHDGSLNIHCTTADCPSCALGGCSYKR